MNASKRRPFNFIHDITKIYFTFHGGCKWFYTTTGYSDEFVQRNGYKFDGQFFYKEAELQPQSPEKGN